MMWVLRGWFLWLCFITILDTLGVDMDAIQGNDAKVLALAMLVASLILTWHPDHDNTSGGK